MAKPSLYTRLRGAADPYARLVGQYTAYSLTGELVGTTYDPPEFVARDLRVSGYDSVRLSAAKRHPVDGRLHLHDVRRVDPDNPLKQYHVHLWATDDGTQIHSHYEYRPDPRPIASETCRDAYDRLQTHYRPGDSYIPGAADPVVRSLLHDRQ